MKETGGAAFPRPIGERHCGVRKEYNDSNEGMTLRDYFAGQALAGLLSIDKPAEVYAMEAYIYADAMLKERAKL